jgi:hypothetical protein
LRQIQAGAELNRPERRPDLDALLGGAAPDRLSIAVLLYLTLPGLIFLPAWLLPWVAAPGAAAGIAALVLARGWHGAWPLTTRASLLCLLGGLAWAALSGAPHFVYSTVDWQIRDAVLSDLAQGAWPVGYHIARQEWLLRAPLGYYMPASLLGQVAGFGAAQLALWAWTGIGLGLVLALLTCLARAGAPGAGWRAVAAMVALFLVFGGLDLLPNAWLDWSAGVGALASWGRGGEWWDRLFQYSGHVTLLLWAPNHALPAWLPLLLLLRHARSPDWMRSSAALLLAGAAFWSPLSAFGAAALMAVAALRFGLRPALRLALSPANLLAVAFLLPFFLYLTAGSSSIPHGPLLWMKADPVEAAWRWGLFLLVEVLPWAACLLLLLRGRLLWASLLLLVLLPGYVFGPGNEMTMRGGIAPLTVFSVAAAIAMVRPPASAWQRRARAGLLACALIGAAGSAMEGSLIVTGRPWPASDDCSLPEAAQQSVFTGSTDWSHYVVRWPDREIESVLRPPQTRPVPKRALARCWPEQPR